MLFKKLDLFGTRLKNGKPGHRRYLKISDKVPKIPNVAENVRRFSDDL